MARAMAKCPGKKPSQKGFSEKRMQRSAKKEAPVFKKARFSFVFPEKAGKAWRSYRILSSQEPVGFLLTREPVVSAKKGFFKDCHVAKLGFAGANPQLACLAMTGNLSFVIARMLLLFFLKEKKGLPAFLCKPQLSCKKVGQRTSVFGAIPKMRSDNCLYSPV